MADETAGYDESVDPIGDTPTAVAPSREQRLEDALRAAREELLVTYDPEMVLRKIDAALEAK